ncbi:hypothetical protein [Inoviridae sp.]|nr:hypothetical protein [Inoviridae sp.]
MRLYFQPSGTAGLLRYQVPLEYNGWKLKYLKASVVTGALSVNERPLMRITDKMSRISLELTSTITIPASQSWVLMYGLGGPVTTNQVDTPAVKIMLVGFDPITIYEGDLIDLLIIDTVNDIFADIGNSVLSIEPSEWQEAFEAAG